MSFKNSEIKRTMLWHAVDNERENDRNELTKNIKIYLMNQNVFLILSGIRRIEQEVGGLTCTPLS